ncbi:MAG: 50S ribosomal protein L10 [Verrucomicrobia bacterium Tous-C9LFEB]|nr:MAG: 50S ribosomal protein L10 [Verrucomicrobia bacterium Tous-C9LFEB]
MRPEKNSIITEIQSKVNASPFVLLTEYAGMRVDHLSELRKRLHGVGAEYRVVKNTLLRRALKDANLPELGGLQGQTAVVLGEKDVCAAAKVLKSFTAEFTKPVIKGGILDNALLDKAQILALADLPSREVLLAKILGTLLAPASQLVRLLNTPASQVAQVLKANAEKQQPAA